MNIYNNLLSALDSLFAHPTWGMVSSSSTGNDWFVKPGQSENSLIFSLRCILHQFSAAIKL